MLVSMLKFPQVLTASVHDVRYLAALLRGVNFVNVRGSSSFIDRTYR
jgi:hypothetical protein